MEMNPNDIELETMNKSFAYERMARDIDEINDIINANEVKLAKNASENGINVLENILIDEKLTVGKLLTLLKRDDMSNIERAEILSIAFQYLPNKIKQSIDWDIHIDEMVNKSKYNNQLKIAPNVPSVIADKFEEILSEYHDEQIESNTLKGIQTVFSNITGDTIQHWGDQCRHRMGISHHLDMCEKVIEYYNKHGEYPPASTHSSSNSIAHKLGYWQSLLKTRKRNGLEIHSLLLKRIDEVGLQDMFDIIDLEKKALSKCKQLIEYYKDLLYLQIYCASNMF